MQTLGSQNISPNSTLGSPLVWPRFRTVQPSSAVGPPSLRPQTQQGETNRVTPSLEPDRDN
jgi:hypothetical protein